MFATFTFGEPLVAFLRPLENIQRFHDVNINCADGSIVPAHRVILSLGSELFNDILKYGLDDPYVHLNSEDVGVLVKVLYVGKVTVDAASVDRFKNIISSFHITGVNCTISEEDPNATEPQYEEFIPRIESTALENIGDETSSNDYDFSWRKLQQLNNYLSQLNISSEVAHVEDDDDPTLVGNLAQDTSDDDDNAHDNADDENDDSSDGDDNPSVDGADGDDDNPSANDLMVVQQYRSKGTPTSAEKILEGLFTLDFDNLEANCENESLLYWLAIIAHRLKYEGKK